MSISISLGSLLGIKDLLWCASQIDSDHSVWIPETWGMECFGVISAVACSSKCRTIGSSIINVYSRSPATIAMGAATADTVSDGRLILGLGSSSPAIVENLHGQTFDLPLSRVSEYVDVIREILKGDVISHTGDLFNLQGFRLLIQPPRKEIPIYLAAVNRKMVELAWRKADGVIFYLRPLTEMAETMRHMQKGRRIQTTCQVITAVSEDGKAAIKRARLTLAFYISVGQIYREFLASSGYGMAIQRIYSEYCQGGLAAAASCIPDYMLKDLTICGTPEQCRASLARFCNTGIDDIIVQFNPVGEVRKSFTDLMVMLQ